MRVGLAAVLPVVLALAPSAMASTVLPAQGSVEVAFSPADDPEALLTGVIGAARQSIHVHAYVLTSKTIANALIAAHRRGVKVEVLADAGMHRRGRNALPALLEAGVPVALETAYAAAHNKVLIVDAAGPSCTVLTGSYNFSWSASNRNAENIIVLRDHCPLAAVYLQNWQRHRAEATVIRQLPWNP